MKNILPNEKEKGIWQYASYLTEVPVECRVSLDEGNTALEKFDENIWLKREDQNPTGSLKDRGMAFVVSKAVSDGHKNFVLSSSGNAAISASQYCASIGANLFVYVSPRMNPEKLKVLKSGNSKVTVTERPLSESQKFTSENNYFSLRLSRIEFAPEGYKTIAFEINQNIGKIDDIFIPVSSGVCALGIYRGFCLLDCLPRIHICQGTLRNPIACLFDPSNIDEESIATALVARTSPLKDKTVEMVKKSGGFGWTIKNDAILLMQKRLEEKNFLTSNEGALALAAAYEAKEKGWKLGKTVVLLTGKRY